MSETSPWGITLYDASTPVDTLDGLLNNHANDLNTALNTLASRSASTTVSGYVELATDTETQTGTDATRAVTPASLKSTLIARGGSKILTGTATIAGLAANGGFTTSAVTFTGGFFSSAPLVFLAQHSSRLTLSISVNATISGFTIGANNWSPGPTASTQVDWVAIGA